VRPVTDDSFDITGERSWPTTRRSRCSCCRLHALVAELVPGGIRKKVVRQAEQILVDV